MNSREKLIMIFLIIAVILSGCLEKIVSDSEVTNETLNNLNDNNIMYGKSGLDILESAQGKIFEGKNKSIGEKIAFLEIGKELTLDADNQSKLGKEINYELWNLSWELYRSGRWNDSKLKRNRKFIEINLKYYNTLMSISGYIRKAYDEYIAMYEIIKNQPTDEEELVGFIASVLIQKPDSSKLSKIFKDNDNIDAQIRLTKGSEYFKNAALTPNLYKGMIALTDEPWTCRISKSQVNIVNDKICDSGDIKLLNSFTGIMAKSYCNDWGLEEECKYIKLKNEEVDMCLENNICSKAEAIGKMKERNEYVKSIVPPRKIDV